MIKILVSFIATVAVCWLLYALWGGLDKKGKQKLLADIWKATVLGLTAILILVAVVYLF